MYNDNRYAADTFIPNMTFVFLLFLPLFNSACCQCNCLYYEIYGTDRQIMPEETDPNP